MIESHLYKHTGRTEIIEVVPDPIIDIDPDPPDQDGDIPNPNPWPPENDWDADPGIPNPDVGGPPDPVEIIDLPPTLSACVTASGQPGWQLTGTNNGVPWAGPCIADSGIGL